MTEAATDRDPGGSSAGRTASEEAVLRVRRLARLLRDELEAEGLDVEISTEDGGPILVVGEMKVHPRRLLEGQMAETGDLDAVDLDWIATAHRTYFRNLRRFHPSLVTRRAS